VWPLPQTDSQAWYFHESGRLDRTLPTADGSDRYAVDFAATPGKRNRWATNNDGGDVVYGNRADADRRLLCYTSAVLPRDMEITGQPIVELVVDSTHSDGAFFVYIEDVTPDGLVRYVAEGQLRAIHRKLSNRAPFQVIGPYHSCMRSDALPLVPGEIAEISFALIPVSVLIKAGHRVRVAIAGADADTFARVPRLGDPILRVLANAEMRPRPNV
jgi:putative CocE/NonD family hydrolase